MDFNIEVTVDVSALVKNLDKFLVALPVVSKKSINESMDILEKNANMFIDQDLHWGHSLNTAERISECWKREFPNDFTGILSNTSPHASIVNYGGIVQTSIEREPGETSFPVGKQEYGVPVAFSDKFQLQPGKFYMERSLFASLEDIYHVFDRNIDNVLKKL